MAAASWIRSWILALAKRITFKLTCSYGDFRMSDPADTGPDASYCNETLMDYRTGGVHDDPVAVLPEIEANTSVTRMRFSSVIVAANRDERQRSNGPRKGSATSRAKRDST